MKRTLKAAICKAGLRWRAADPASRVIVLCYHSIDRTKSFASASPATFAAHLDWLTDHCDVVPLQQIVQGRLDGRRTRPVVAITFDDGHADNYECAFPLLHSRGLPATFFITAGFVDKDPTVIERFARLLRASSSDDLRPLEWAHVRAMHAAGIEIGAHTYSHPNLAVLPRARAADELQRSKQIIEEHLGAQVRSMAYPFGKPGRHFTQETVTLAKGVGYEYACAVLFRAVRPADARLAIPRLFVTQDTVRSLGEKIWGGWDLIGRWQETCPRWIARLVSPDDFGERA